MRLPNPGWKTTLLLCLFVALGVAVAVDQVRVARSVRSTPDDVGDTAHRLMAARVIADQLTNLHLDEPAPDFVLPAISEQREVRLSNYRGKPVVLMFGSLTCDVLCTHLAEIDRLRGIYGERAAFLFVYISEAGHTIDGLEFLLDGEEPTRPSLDRRKKRSRLPPAERQARLLRAIKKMNLHLPVVVDAEGIAEEAYNAFPMRMVVVDAQGRIAVDAGNGMATSLRVGAVELWLQHNVGG